MKTINKLRQSDSQAPLFIAFGALMVVTVTALVLTGLIDPMS